MRPPNLFEEARGELAQDAFLAWLLKHAGPELATVRPGVHAAALRLARAAGLLEPSEVPAAIDATCQTGRGRVRPDLVVTWLSGRERRAAVVEHKVHAGLDPRQLKKYRAAAEALTGLPPSEVRYVFIKTGLLTSRERGHAKEPWKVLDLDDVVQALAPRDVPTGSEILDDYVARLRGIQRDITGWMTAPPPARDPTHLSWQGLFEALTVALQERLGSHVDHGVVNPPGGGPFAGIWWGWRTAGDVELYLQAHPVEGQLGARVAVKCQVPGRDKCRVPTPVLRRYRDLVSGSPPFSPARPLRSGKHSAVAYALGEWWRATPTGAVDLDQTVSHLVSLTGALDAVAPR